MIVKNLSQLKTFIDTIEESMNEINRIIEYDDVELNTDIDLYSSLADIFEVAESIYNKQKGIKKWK